MKFNKSKISPFKGRFIKMKYRAGESNNIQTGIISGIGDKQILFNANTNGIEIPIKYERIINIEKLKSRRATKLMIKKKK